MSRDVDRSLSDSAYDFARLVVPAIGRLIGPGRIDPVESTTSSGLKHDLDVLAGVDCWQIQDGQGRMRAIASRVQWVDRSFRTFTIRAGRENGIKTEWAKRVEAFLQPESGWLLPALTVQAYLTRPRRAGQLIEAAVIRTVDLYEYAIKNPCKQPKNNYTDGPGRTAWFDWYLWDDLLRDGRRVGIVAGPRAQSLFTDPGWDA